jgi:hypothetical protein
VGGVGGGEEIPVKIVYKNKKQVFIKKKKEG